MSAQTLLDTREHVTAIRAALDAALAPDVHTYEWGRVPGESGNTGTLPAIWALVSVARRFNPSLRLSAQAGVSLWRVTVGVVGSTPNEARWALHRVAVALNEEPLTIAGEVSSPLQADTETSPRRDDDRYYAAAVYTYAL